jgi:hypothetical protein
MKCGDCQRFCLENAGGDLPPDVSAHLIECAECRKAHARAITVGQLLSLKKYEQPDPLFETRLLAKVQAGIRELDEQPHGLGARLWQLFAGEQIPALRYAMALMVVVLIGLNTISVQNMPVLPSTSIEAQRTPAPAPTVASAGPTNRYFNPSLPVVFLQSNTQPASLQFGPGRSRLAGFEY